MLLEEEAEIQERLRKQSPLLQQQRDQKPPDATVPVEIGVDALELHVHQRGADERGQLVVTMDVLLEVTEQPPELVRRRRHKGGVARTCAADPVLGAADLARLSA